jgi:hypothetical protein
MSNPAISLKNADTAGEILKAAISLQDLAQGKVNLRDVAEVAASAFSYTINEYHDKAPGNVTWQCLGEWFLEGALGGNVPSAAYFEVMNQALLELPEVVVLYLMQRDGIDWDSAVEAVATMEPFEISSE